MADVKDAQRHPYDSGFLEQYKACASRGLCTLLEELVIASWSTASTGGWFYNAWRKIHESVATFT